MEGTVSTALPGSDQDDLGDQSAAPGADTYLISQPAKSTRKTHSKLLGAANGKGWWLAALSSLLLVLAFPDFNLWPLAWVSLVPLLVAIARRPMEGRAFLRGWGAGSAFFYGTCYWLTYSMIHFAEFRAWQAYALLVPGAVVLGLFPALFATALTRLIRAWGLNALFAAPVLWVTLEWMRLSVTGQLWNAIGYSQAFHPAFIQMARWGGVYAVGFLIVAINAAIAVALIQRTAKAAVISALVSASVVIVIVASSFSSLSGAPIESSDQRSVTVVALQPNVPMNFDKPAQEMRELLSRHLSESERGLRELQRNDWPRLVIWPESPMNFAFGEDSQLRDSLGRFTQQNHTSLIFNSQEPAPDNSSYNSALMINEAGRLVAQYDKIRLMPFGEYVPLPLWLPGAERVRGIVGGFTPGVRYTLMPVGTMRAGVFICIESAYPWIARTFTAEGADVLINISNDGYLGPTPVVKQHLANAIFRAVENGRPLLRVTNTGTTAYITPRGDVHDPTKGFQTAVRTWTIADGAANNETFYTRHGDLFVAACAALGLLMIALSFVSLRGKI